MINNPTEKLPIYNCHKQVRASKILFINGPFAFIGPIEYTLTLQGFLMDNFEWQIEQDWYDRFKPEIGGFLVIYEDGYTSYSPAKAFEDGYTIAPMPISA